MPNQWKVCCQERAVARDAPNPPMACPKYKPVVCMPIASPRDFPVWYSAMRDRLEGMYRASLMPITARSQYSWSKVVQ